MFKLSFDNLAQSNGFDLPPQKTSVSMLVRACVCVKKNSMPMHEFAGYKYLQSRWQKTAAVFLQCNVLNFSFCLLFTSAVGENRCF